MARRKVSAFDARVTVEDLWRDQKADYDSAKPSRLRKRPGGLPSGGAGADYHIRSENDFLFLTELARYYRRNDPLVGQGIRRLTSLVVRDGMTLWPETGSAAANDLIRAKWEKWSRDPGRCHVAGEHNFHRMEKLAFGSMIGDGDCFFVPTIEGSLDVFESHRCRTPTWNKRAGIVHGVKVDSRGRRESYFFTNADVDPLSPVKVGAMTEVPANDADGFRQVFHVYDPDRPSQTRGVTALAPVMDIAGILGDVHLAKLIQQKITSHIAIIRNKKRGMSGTAPGAGSSTKTETNDDGTPKTIVGTEPGGEYVGNEDEEISGFSPNIPGTGYFEQTHVLTQLMAINLDLPLIVFLLDSEATNFSGFKGSMDTARLRFRTMQRNLIDALHRPTYEWKMRDWLATDAEIQALAKDDSIDLFSYRFNPPAWSYIDPEKERKAQILAGRNGASSWRRIHADQGQHFPEELEHIVEDNAAVIRAAKRMADVLNAELDLELTWREVFSLPLPDGFQVSIGGETSSDAAPVEKRTPTTAGFGAAASLER